MVYPIANLLSTFIKAKSLFEASSIIFVYDPKRLKCHHCGDCKAEYDAAYATKCDITGRNKRGVAAESALDAYKNALAAYLEATRTAHATWRRGTKIRSRRRSMPG